MDGDITISLCTGIEICSKNISSYAIYWVEAEEKILQKASKFSDSEISVKISCS